MRVLVAGATGALGRRLVVQLVERGHDVVGTTRHRSKLQSLESLGAGGVVCDALDAPALTDCVGRTAPQVVVHALTALPPAGPTRIRDLRATDRLRVDGTRNLVAAAKAGGVRRIVAESMTLIYGDTGLRLATESDPPATAEKIARLPRRVAGGMADAVAAMQGLESQVLGASTAGLEGVVLRFGLFYGPGTSSDVWARQLRRRQMPVPRSSRSRVSWIHIDDAASATVAVIERGRPGAVYNVVDDEPAGLPSFVDELARVVDAPPPLRVPLRLARLVAPYAAAVADARVAVSNARLREELGWRPAFPSYREGLRRERPSPSTVKG